MNYEIESNVSRTNKNYLIYVSIVLNKIIEMNEKKEGKITNFHASTIPNISINKYVERIGKYIGCSNECFVLLIIYVDRLIKLHKDITLSLLCIHRIIITAAVIAAKFLDDLYYSNSFYAKIGGVTTQELNELEIYFLNLLDYKLYVSSQEYEFYRKYITISVQTFLRNQMIKKQNKAIVKPKQFNLFNFNANVNTSYDKYKPKLTDIRKMSSIPEDNNYQFEKK